mgnify:CR=1 FL=1
MKARSKFYGVQYPLFGLRKKPYNFSIRLDTITVQKEENTKECVIDKFQEKVPYLNRYLAANNGDFSFDFSCLTVSHIISKPIRWGIDSSAKVFDFTTKQTFKARNVPIIRVKETLIWVKTVSYPFKVPKLLVDTAELLDQHLTIVYIDDDWVPLKFTSFSEKVDEIKL